MVQQFCYETLIDINTKETLCPMMDGHIKALESVRSATEELVTVACMEWRRLDSGHLTRGVTTPCPWGGGFSMLIFRKYQGLIAIFERKKSLIMPVYFDSCYLKDIKIFWKTYFLV